MSNMVTPDGEALISFQVRPPGISELIGEFPEWVPEDHRDRVSFLLTSIRNACQILDLPVGSLTIVHDDIRQGTVSISGLDHILGEQREDLIELMNDTMLHYRPSDVQGDPIIVDRIYRARNRARSSDSRIAS